MHSKHQQLQVQHNKQQQQMSRVQPIRLLAFRTVALVTRGSDHIAPGGTRSLLHTLPAAAGPPLRGMPWWKGWKSRRPGTDNLHQATQMAAADSAEGSGKEAAAQEEQAAGNNSPAGAPLTYDEGWVNRVGLTGVVVRGPLLQRFTGSGSRKTLMVLALCSRHTGDYKTDLARPILVEAWNETAERLAQSVQPGALVYVAGHLALDSRPEQRSSGHGPALVVIADEWWPVAADTVPEGTQPYTYKGEFDAVLNSQWGRAGTATTAVTAAPGASADHAHQAPASRPASSAAQQQGRPGFDRALATQLLHEGKTAVEIAEAVGVQPSTIYSTVFKDVLDRAEKEGPGSSWWPALLAFAELAHPNQQPGLDASSMLQAVEAAVRLVPQPSGQLRLKPIREYLVSDSSAVGGWIQAQEGRSGNLNLTYTRIQLLLAMGRAGCQPS